MSYWVLGFLIIIIIVCFGYVFLHPHIKGFMNKWYFWTIFAILWFGYSFFQYIDYVFINGLYASDARTVQNDPFGYYNMYGDITLTAFCGFMNLFLPLFLIFNPSRRIAKFIAPIGFMAGFIVMATYLPDASLFNSAKSVFYENYASVFRHAILCIMCFLIMLNVPKYQFKNKDLWWAIGIWGSYFIYIAIISNLALVFPNVHGTVMIDGEKIPVTYNVYGDVPANGGDRLQYIDSNGDAQYLFPDRHYFNCSGLYIKEWITHGQYGAFPWLDKYWPLPFVLFLLIIAFLYAVCWHGTNLLKHFKPYQYKEPKHWYLKSTKQPRPWWKW